MILTLLSISHVGVYNREQEALNEFPPCNPFVLHRTCAKVLENKWWKSENQVNESDATFFLGRLTQNSCIDIHQTCHKSKIHIIIIMERDKIEAFRF